MDLPLQITTPKQKISLVISRTVAQKLHIAPLKELKYFDFMLETPLFKGKSNNRQGGTGACEPNSSGYQKTWEHLNW
jgi:hypothetical protein